jgi:diguanylate cyclase (GGDEF)-like protein
MRLVPRPVRIATLSAGFVVLVGLLVATMGGMLWLELEHVSASIRAKEAELGRNEIAQANTALEQRMMTIGQTLANWDETRQQLIFDEYYTLWRDVRVRDARIVPPSTDTVALYDKLGRLLKPQRNGESMPLRLPVRPPAMFVMREQGHDHLYGYFPIHADPAGEILLGYAAIKCDYIHELLVIQPFRYVDKASLKIEARLGEAVPLREMFSRLRFAPLANQDVDALRQTLGQAYTRLILATFLVLALGAWLVHQVLVRPLRLITQGIDALQTAGGSLVSERALGPVPIRELDNVRASFNDYHLRLTELHRNLEQSNRDFYDQARRDALTGAFNRRAFEEDWRRLAVSEACTGCSLILFDCDHFKAINDTYGHLVGDAVIAAIAGSLRQALRADDKLYRIGGDEFATLLCNTEPRVAQLITERCLEHTLAHDFREYGVLEPVTISIGLAYSACARDLGTLQKQADLAMYTAKRPGNRKIVVYDESIGQVSALVANREVSVVFQAIQQPDMLEFRYQPIMRLPETQEEYVEALARIRCDDCLGGLISPAAIFPIVQARRLDVEFDLAVIAAIRRDLERGLPALARGVAINLSAPGLLSGKVIAALEALRATFSQRKLVVEITETALITQLEAAIQHIDRLRAAGFQIALDDFGSGYSSLRYLAAMPVDLVKFDISLVHQLLEGSHRQHMVVEDIARLVLNAGYELVAEGIETPELLTKVTDMGFSHAQGFLFDRPPV